MSKSRSAWFEVDPAGLRELFGSIPPERLVLELIQNVWDEAATVCEVAIRDDEHDGRRATIVTVADDNPEGFRNLADAYTLFGTTAKRLDPEKRGRFNLGEKLVIARALSAKISTTKGEVRFDRTGRHIGRAKRLSGSEVTCVFPRWKAAETVQASTFLHRLIPPKGISFTLNGAPIAFRAPELVHEATLPTVILSSVEDGVWTMTRTQRKTSMSFYPVANGSPAYLFELGIPVCEIAGNYDVSIGQKVPLQAERLTVAPSFLQDVYAEMLRSPIRDRLDVAKLGAETVQLALADDRVDATTAKQVFATLYGNTAAIQSHDPDSDQEAVRLGYTLVPSRTFGREVNDKLRGGGVQTTHDLFGRHRSELAEIIPAAQHTPQQRSFVNYVKLLAAHLYHDTTFSVELGTWEHSRAIAFNQNETYLVFHVGRVDMDFIVSRSTDLVLHELAHCKGAGHDGVYDNEHSRLVNAHTVLLAQHPELYRPFEPALFERTA